MTARCEAEPHEGITRLQECEKHRLVGLSAGVRLHVGVGAVEKLLGTLNGQLFGFVHILATTIIATAGVAFGIFVCKHRALSLQNGPRNDVFGSNEFDFALLSRKFAADDGAERRIDRPNSLPKERGNQGSLTLSRGFPCHDDTPIPDRFAANTSLSTAGLFASPSNTRRMVIGREQRQNQMVDPNPKGKGD